VLGKFSCGEIRSKRLDISKLEGKVSGKDGVIELTPVTMQLFGARASGSVRADLSAPVPRIQLRFTLPKFHIEEFLKTLSPEKGAEGQMDFSADLAMQGSTLPQWLASAAGDLSLRGRDLTLVGNDLDRALARFESSQGFNLVDVGAVFFAGPMGLAVTKGYNFASLFRGSGGDSHVAVLVSEWRVEGGVAHAKDVAMATPRNRIALQGGLDFVHQRFADVTVAVVNKQGCATVRQVIHGSFEKPVVEKPHVITSLAGPVLKLVRQTRGLFPGGPCEAFYSGSVQPPG
jgi:AsmA protein